MSLQYFEEKKNFFEISFYLNIVCKNIVCDVSLRRIKLSRPNEYIISFFNNNDFMYNENQ